LNSGGSSTLRNIDKRYTGLVFLGNGTFGSVFKCYRKGKLIALKVVCLKGMTQEEKEESKGEAIK
jgi:hypothetical protein